MPKALAQPQAASVEAKIHLRVKFLTMYYHSVAIQILTFILGGLVTLHKTFKTPYYPMLNEVLKRKIQTWPRGRL